jgi:3',5'-cyclic AMP phosphodiesterase CpdA
MGSGKLLTIGLILVSPAVVPAVAAETARGVVFEDRDGNGRRGAAEPGVAGVSVSDGRSVVVTDGEGRYALPVEAGSVIFVSKPRDFAVPVDELGRPQFFYRHFPFGSPGADDLRYAGVAPTGPLPESVDFPLRRRDEGDTFRAVLLADTQPQTEAELDYVRDDVLAELLDVEADVGLTLGDIMFDDLSLLPRYVRLIGGLGLPWYHVPGNHDINFRAEGDETSLATFQRFFGPPYYSFDHGPVHVVVLDTVDYHGRDSGERRGQGRYVGRVGERQLAWLRADLAQVPDGRFVLLAMHVPLVTHLAPDSPRLNVADRAELLEVLSGRSRLLAVAGHTHTTEHHYLGADEGSEGAAPLHLHIVTTASGSWWSGPRDGRGIPETVQRDGTPNGWNLLTVEEDRGARVDFRAAGRPPDEQLRIEFDTSFHGYGRNPTRDVRAGALRDGRIGAEELEGTELVVNLFNGGPRSQVSFRVGEGPSRPMERVCRIDPYVEELFTRHRKAIKSWIEPVPSTHLWAAPLPVDLEPGVHVVTVEAIDDYGHRHTGRRLLEVTGGR